MKDTLLKILFSVDFVLYSFLMVLIGFTLGVFSTIEPPPISDTHIKIPYKISNKESQGTLESTVGIHTNTSVCSGTVVDEHFIVTAAHCISENDKLIQGKVQVLDKDGVVQATAVPAAYNPRVDYGILIGNFSKFKYMKVEIESDVFSIIPPNDHHFLACGYPFGQKQMICVPFKPVGTYEFTIKGYGGVFLPGMSGGTVLDLDTNKLAAVITGVDSRFNIVTSTVGLFGAFGIEP